MSEYSDNKLGQIQIADEVIAIIAGAAAAEVEGVTAVAGAPVESIAGLFGKKNLAKGVRVSIEDGVAAIDIEIAVKYGAKLRAAAQEVQNKVKTAVETMTGLTVETVDINISCVVVEKPKKEDKDLE